MANSSQSSQDAEFKTLEVWEKHFQEKLSTYLEKVKKNYKDIALLSKKDVEKATLFLKKTNMPKLLCPANPVVGKANLVTTTGEAREASIEEAIKAVKGGMSQMQASQQYGVSKSTLSGRLKKRKGEDLNQSQPSRSEPITIPGVPHSSINPGPSSSDEPKAKLSKTTPNIGKKTPIDVKKDNSQFRKQGPLAVTTSGQVYQISGSQIRLPIGGPSQPHPPVMSRQPNNPRMTHQTSIWNPLSLTQINKFSAKFANDKAMPDIKDVKILGEGLILVADSSTNQCLKLLSTRGGEITKKALEHPPLSMAVLDMNAHHEWDVAVTLEKPEKEKVILLKITETTIDQLEYPHGKVDLTKACNAIAAINKNILVVGYQNVKGISMINTCGKIEGELSKIRPVTLSSSMKGDEVVCIDISNKDVVKLDTQNKTEIFRGKVEQVKVPIGISFVQDKLLIADKKSVHLVGSERCQYIRRLWEPELDTGDSLVSFSSTQNPCVFATKRGQVYKLESLS